MFDNVNLVAEVIHIITYDHCGCETATSPTVVCFLVMEKKNKKKKGVFLSEEVLQDNRLDFFEKTLFALYLSYTLYGRDRCCHMTYEQINDFFGGEISESRYHRAKRTLKELGLIETKGIVTKASKGGVKNDRGVSKMTGGVSKMTPIIKNHNINP